MLYIKSYSFVSLLIPSSPNVVSMLQALTLMFFWDFIILFDSSHDYWENEVLFVEIGARVLDLSPDTFSGLKWPKCSF